MATHNEFWSTACELEFIERVVSRHKTNRPALVSTLKNLRDAYKRRNVWGRIDRDEVLGFVCEQIQRVGAV